MNDIFLLPLRIFIFYFFPNSALRIMFPIFLSKPAFEVGMPVFLAICCFACVIPNARFNEKLRPGMGVDFLLMIKILR